ncbi:MAG: fluoride efflux transporter CrcB [Candidatus Dadabacteria bacterium]|nr:MAG: fluoride efflux transporter CrcB [Candidatus Dadabacteria bacterium]
MVLKFLWLAIAGAIGTVARYGLAGLIHNKLKDASFPWGTIGVNILGCFLVGFLWIIFEEKVQLSPETRTIILVGFFGAFTTFSAYILETSELFRSAEWYYGAANILIQNGLGLLGIILGAAVAKIV